MVIFSGTVNLILHRSRFMTLTPVDTCTENHTDRATAAWLLSLCLGKIAFFGACVLPAGRGAGQGSSEADWLVDRLVEVISQMTVQLAH